MVSIGVVRGAENINVAELGVYSRLPKYGGHHVELVCSDRTWVTPADAGMPQRRLAPPPVVGRIAKTTAGGYLVGRFSRYRYLHQYLTGFHRAVRDFGVLAPVDLGHPTSYQSVLEKRFGKKVIVQCWENIPFNWPSDRPLRYHYEAVLREADHFVAPTEGSRRALRAEGVGDRRISRVNTGIDTSFWKPSDPYPPPSSGPLKMLFVGRLHWQKGVHTVIEAMGQIPRPVHLTIVGRGPELARLSWLLSRYAQANGGGTARNVQIVTERMPQEQLRLLRAQSDVQVVPSIPTAQWREQMNLGMLEGMACGLPVIASNTGGIPEAISQGAEGILVSPDNPTEFAEAIERMDADPGLRARMGRAARERILRDYEVEKQAQRLAGVISEVAG